MRNTTLKDVAAQAGVSTATVSRVLHNNGYVSELSRARVEVALRESGYRLNTVAQELRTQRTIALGLILHGFANPFFAEVAMGVEHAAAEQGFNVLLFNARGEQERERQSVETLLSRRVDGIIFTAALDERNIQLALDAGVSVVEIERQVGVATPSVTVDNTKGVTEAMEHLLQLGHRRIGYLGEPYEQGEAPLRQPRDRIVQVRFEAYRAALGAAGLALDEAHVVRGAYPREVGGWGGLQTGADYMMRLLDQAPDLTAVFAASDILAAGALQALYERGVRVPAELSIVGFDDTFASHLTPPLTSVRQPMFEMGLTAATLAIDQLAGGVAPTAVTCPMELVVRKSTAPPQGDG